MPGRFRTSIRPPWSTKTVWAMPRNSPVPTTPGIAFDHLFKHRRALQQGRPAIEDIVAVVAHKELAVDLDAALRGNRNRLRLRRQHAIPNGTTSTGSTPCSPNADTSFSAATTNDDTAGTRPRPRSSPEPGPLPNPLMRSRFRGHLVGPIDGHVDGLDIVQRDQRNAQLGRPVRGGERCRNAADSQAIANASPEQFDDCRHRVSGSQPYDRTIFDQLHRCFSEGNKTLLAFHCSYYRGHALIVPIKSTLPLAPVGLHRIDCEREEKAK